MRKNSIKNTRINMEVQRELSEIIRTEIKDPRVNGAMTSVVAVEVTPDLKYCKAYISVLGDEERAKDALTGLKSAVGYIRRELAHRVNLRNTHLCSGPVHRVWCEHVQTDRRGNQRFKRLRKE